MESQPKSSPAQVVTQDQDTVIGDALCHAAILVYDAAVSIARCIADNAQYAIDLEELNKAELALAYMQGVDFGLAMDDKRDKAYLALMEKAMSSIRRSKKNGFQFQVYTPPAPWDYLEFDEQHARANGTLFVHAVSDAPPSEKDIKELEDEMLRSEGKDPGKLVPDPSDPTGRTLVYADLPTPETDEQDPNYVNGGEDDDNETIDEEVVVGDEAIPKKSPRIIKKKENKLEQKMENDGADFKAKVAKAIKKIKSENSSLKFKDLKIYSTDDGVTLTFSTDGKTDGDKCSSSRLIEEELIKNGLEVKHRWWLQGGLNCQHITIRKPSRETLDGIKELCTLKNLYRTKRINKTALKGGLATLLAAGIISKAEFYGAMNDAE